MAETEGIPGLDSMEHSFSSHSLTGKLRHGSCTVGPSISSDSGCAIFTAETEIPVGDAGWHSEHIFFIRLKALLRSVRRPQHSTHRGFEPGPGIQSEARSELDYSPCCMALPHSPPPPLPADLSVLALHCPRCSPRAPTSPVTLARHLNLEFPEFQQLPTGPTSPDHLQHKSREGRGLAGASWA